MVVLEWCQIFFLGFLNDHWFSNWSSSAQDVGYIPLLFFRNGTLKPFFRNSNFKLALMSSPRFSEAIWVLNSDWVSDSILNVDWLYFHMWRVLYAKLIGRIALFTSENITYVQKCRQWRKWQIWRNFVKLTLGKLAIFMQIMSPEISLTCWQIWRIWRFLCKLCHQRYPWQVGEFGDFDDFHANYVTRDIPDMLANLVIFMEIMSPEISLTSWRIWRFWRFLCKLCHQTGYPWHVGKFGDFGDFYANYVTRDIPDMLANLANLAIFMQIISPEISLTCWRIWRIWRFLYKLHLLRWA